ncbi:MAG TPA: ethanolamine ammonia-lyase subunit EutC [Thermoflexales bacterium]|nr:ethanolamine ammonia-lyase subunit EutC [Thermoflexales bacterium]HRA53432.1 ethanolamine ammonia-lyase subunit EutC [Thermoflexales bacterium]
MSDLIIDLPDPTARMTARIGLSRAGARPRTRSQRVFDADHAITQDALAETVPPELLEELGLFSVASAAPDRETYLLRPDLGRRLSDPAMETLRANINLGADVQIFVSDGLSARAVTVNLPELLPALRIALAEQGLRMGPPFFVRLGRVGLLNAVNGIADARVVVILVGERPGLGRADALSAYLGYRPQVDSSDADREVICNIFPGGLPPREAALRITEQIIGILSAGASGVRRGLRS